MANEANINCSLRITKSNLQYQSLPGSFRATVAGSKGPTPGAIQATTAGTDVDLSQLTTPGLCRIMNLDNTNYVEYGIWVVSLSRFIPFGQVLPGESYIVRLSPNLKEEFLGTGTGTTAEIDRFRIKAHGASCNVVVDAFEA